MIVADASWIIALRDADDPHHASAITLNEATVDDVIVVHPVTLAECLVGAARLGQLDAGAAALRAAFEVADIDIDAPLRWANIRSATSLRLPDAIALDTARAQPVASSSAARRAPAACTRSGPATRLTGRAITRPI